MTAVFSKFRLWTAENAAQRGAERTQRQLNKLPIGLSCDNSSLRTACDEFGAQALPEKTFLWHADVVNVTQAIARGRLSVRHREMMAIWLESGNDCSWLADNEDGKELPSVFPSDVVEIVCDKGHDLANRSRHPRAVRYRSRDRGFT